MLFVTFLLIHLNTNKSRRKKSRRQRKKRRHFKRQLYTYRVTHLSSLIIRILKPVRSRKAVLNVGLLRSIFRIAIFAIVLEIHTLKKTEIHRFLFIFIDAYLSYCKKIRSNVVTLHDKPKYRIRMYLASILSKIW